MDTLAYSRTDLVCNEKALWAAVVAQAIVDIQRPVVPQKRSAHRVKPSVATSTRAKSRRTAIAWINGSDEEAPSFAWACDILGLCPNQVREKILTEEVHFDRKEF